MPSAKLGPSDHPGGIRDAAGAFTDVLTATNTVRSMSTRTVVTVTMLAYRSYSPAVRRGEAQQASRSVNQLRLGARMAVSRPAKLEPAHNIAWAAHSLVHTARGPPVCLVLL